MKATDDNGAYSTRTGARRARFDAIEREWIAAIRAITESMDVFALIKAVEATKSLKYRIMSDAGSPFGLAGNGPLDIELMGGCLRRLVRELVDSNEPLLARDLAARAGVREDDAKLALYYLNKFGSVERERRGRTFAHRLTSTQLRSHAVEREWTSIQKRVQPNDSPPVAEI